MDPTSPTPNSTPTPTPEPAPTPATPPAPQPTVSAPQTSATAQASSPAAAPTTQAPAVKQPTKITKQWYFWTIIVLAVFCLASLIFAGYALSQNGILQDQVNQLNKTITEKDALLAKYAAQLGQLVDDSSHSGYIDESKTTTKDFLYIGEWGIKFKIPAELTNISYIYQTEITEPAVDPETGEAIAGATPRKTETLCVTGMPKSAEHLPEYFQLGVKEATLGCIVKQPDNNLGADSQAQSVYQDGTSYYIYHREHNLKSSHEDDRALERQAIDLVQELLAKNITKF